METMKAIAIRKSVRGYKSEQISEEVLNNILAAGCAAPVGMAQFDTLHLTVVQNEAVLKQFNDAVKKVFEQMMKKEMHNDPSYGAPTIVLISSKDPMPGMEGMEYFNVGCVAENMMLAAADAGVGSCVAGATKMAVESDMDLKKALGIPEGFKALYGVMLGYAVEEDKTEKDMKVKLSLNRI